METNGLFFQNRALGALQSGFVLFHLPASAEVGTGFGTRVPENQKICAKQNSKVPNTEIFPKFRINAFGNTLNNASASNLFASVNRMVL